MVSTLDWALMEIWKDAGIPLEAVLRGIDAAFDRYDQRPSKARKINGLGWCAQAVLAAAEDMKEAVVGAPEGGKAAAKPPPPARVEPKAVSPFFRPESEFLKAGKVAPTRGSFVPTRARGTPRALHA